MTIEDWLSDYHLLWRCWYDYETAEFVVDIMSRDEDDSVWSGRGVSIEAAGIVARRRWEARASG